jgi:hypothetical protein
VRRFCLDVFWSTSQIPPGLNSQSRIVFDKVL